MEIKPGYIFLLLLTVLFLVPAYATPTADGAADIISTDEQPSTRQAAAALSDWAPPENLLWDNGPVANRSGTGVGGADESVVQNVTVGLGSIGFGNQAGIGNLLADDFVVGDAGWYIEGFTFFSYHVDSPTEPSPVTAVNYRIWDGLPDDPTSSVIYGDLSTNQMSGTEWSNAYRVIESFPVPDDRRPIMAVTAGVPLAVAVNAEQPPGTLFLPPGSYWLEWQIDGSPADISGPFAPPITITGECVTGNARQFQPLDGWRNAVDALRGEDCPQGFSFLVQGTAARSAPGAATLISPTGLIDNPAPLYQWHAVENASWYYLWVRNSKGNDSAQWLTAEQANCSDETGQCEFNPITPEFYGDGSFSWWIQTWNEFGYGPWSEGMRYTVGEPLVPEAPILIEPVDTVTDQTPTFEWNPANGATWYRLQVWKAGAPDFTTNQWYQADQLACEDELSNCTATPDAVLDVGNYYWRALGWNNAGVGDWSVIGGFDVVAP